MVAGGRLADEAPEHAREVRGVIEADGIGDLDACGSARKSRAIAIREFQQESPERHAVFVMEHAAEFRFGKVAKPGHGLEPGSFPPFTGRSCD